MGKIQVLDQQTIDKIAAGEVVERPSSVVKELVENAVDAGATAVTVEIKEGGTTFLRVTDNGSGMEKEQVPLAFLRHSTSKIRCAEDLTGITTLGFRGEALSSIAAVSMVELITKTRQEETGVRYCIEGGVEKGLEEAAAPEGTTFLIRSLFYNTPARRKFLRSPMTEGGYIGELMERMALCRPDISFRFINNGQTKLHTAGSHSLKDVIYQIYGREIAANIIEIQQKQGPMEVTGYIGKPLIGRGNRNFETYFVNGRYVKSRILAQGIEDAYQTFLMQHKYPFVVLHLTLDGQELDVNVHPTKMELRFSNQEEVYRFVQENLRNALLGRELIPQVSLGGEPKEKEPVKEEQPEGAKPGKSIPQGGGDGKAKIEKPRTETLAQAQGEEHKFETKAFAQAKEEALEPEIPLAKAYEPRERNLEYFLEEMRKRVKKAHEKSEDKKERSSVLEPAISLGKQKPPEETAPQIREKNTYGQPEQLELFDQKLLDPKSKKDIRVIGQLFDTYWLAQLGDQFYMIDQHAAHEKVLFERMMKQLENREIMTQMISPPLILSLNLAETEILKAYEKDFSSLGFTVEPFGGREYAIRQVPVDLYGIAERELFLEMLDSLGEAVGAAPTGSRLILEKIASMSCKGAVKGKQRLSHQEALELIETLFTLENPYTCPHGRPTIISMTRQEIERKFKRIV
ncbi:MAG: DNA mismatch repair endonuclease MutL [Lachnospiraceae bacterium]|nr:DNA mismatch repair endonuclease MutL [Lachnospiraceae bacterium]